MRRRKLAIGVAVLLGGAAASLCGAFAFLELSPRDYRLVWMLRQTKRIEMSSPETGMVVYGTESAEEVAAIVGAVTAKLDHSRNLPPQTYMNQICFILNDGREVALVLSPASFSDEEPEQVPVLIRMPGESRLRTYEIDGGRLRNAKWPQCRFTVGHFTTGAVEAEVTLCFEDARSHWVRLSGGGPWAPWRDCNARLTGENGESRPDLLLDSPPQTGWPMFRWTAPPALDRFPSIEITVDGSPFRFSLPPIRYAEPIVPQCPRCGSVEHVLYWESDADNGDMFHGKCKRDRPVRRKNWPSNGTFHCEACDRDFW